jgi:hypothetical protein
MAIHGSTRRDRRASTQTGWRPYRTAVGVQLREYFDRFVRGPAPPSSDYYEWTFTDPGGLIVYGPDYFEDFQPAAGYLDRILANYGCKCQQASGYLSIVRPRRRLASPSADSARHRQPNRIASITEHLKDFREASMFGWGGPTISLL